MSLYHKYCYGESSAVFYLVIQKSHVAYKKDYLVFNRIQFSTTGSILSNSIYSTYAVYDATQVCKVDRDGTLYHITYQGNLLKLNPDGSLAYSVDNATDSTHDISVGNNFIFQNYGSLSKSLITVKIFEKQTGNSNLITFPISGETFAQNPVFTGNDNLGYLYHDLRNNDSLMCFNNFGSIWNATVSVSGKYIVVDKSNNLLYLGDYYGNNLEVRSASNGTLINYYTYQTGLMRDGIHLSSYYFLDGVLITLKNGKFFSRVSFFPKSGWII